MARLIREKGGEIHLHHETNAVHTTGAQVREVEATNTLSGERVEQLFAGDYFFSTMPIKEPGGGHAAGGAARNSKNSGGFALP